MPSIIRKETAQEGYRAPFGDHPLLGHIAIYSINLILLRVIVSDEPFVFDEDQIGRYEDGARPWDRLAHLWRSWFALDNLNGVTAVLRADRRDSQIIVGVKDKFQIAESQDRLETYLNVGIALGDNISSGLTGLLIFDPSKDNQLKLEEIAARLGAEKIDLEFQIAMKGLFESERALDYGGAGDFIVMVRQTLEMALRAERHDELEYIALSLRRASRRLNCADGRRMGGLGELEDFRGAIDPRMAFEVAMLNPQAGVVLFQVAKEIADRRWRHAFGREFFEFGFRRHHPMQMMDRDPDAWFAWLHLVREFSDELSDELSGERFFERYGIQQFDPEFFERALDPRYLLEMSERKPQAALAWVELSKEMLGGRFLKRYEGKLFPRKFFERTIDSGYLVDLSERNPEAALAWVHLVGEVGEEEFLERLKDELFNNEFFVRAIDPQRLLELSERSPEAALAHLELLQELGARRSLERYGRKLFHRGFFKRLFDRGTLIELSERSPEVALAWVQLVRELDSEQFLERSKGELFPAQFFERVLRLDTLIRLGQRNPQTSLAWLELVLELGGQRFLEKHGEQFIERTIDRSTLPRLLRERPASFAMALRFARSMNARELSLALARCFDVSRDGTANGRLAWSSLSLASLPDLHWLAATTGNRELMLELSAFSRLNVSEGFPESVE
jgi:hypothetical protein